MKPCAIAFGMLAILAFVAAAQKVKMSDLPPAVQKTVRQETRNATLVGLSKEREGGNTVYELETKVNGRGRDLKIDSAGAVLSVEEEVALESIPPAAKAAIEKKAAGGIIAKVETLTKGKTVTYEATVRKNGRASEITVAADGSPAR